MDAVSPPPPSKDPLRNIPLALSPSSRIKVKVIGRPRRLLMDAYVRLMSMKWRHLLLLFVSGFLGFNLFFATLYWLAPGSLVDTSNSNQAASYGDAFFFSVQTVATIGYGVIYPNTLFANLLVTFEIMAGVIGFAMGNGLMFARFSRPTARIMFSKVAIIAPHNGTPTLMFRAANQRHNLILEAQVKVSLSRSETSIEGRTMRRFRDLPVERRENPTFILSWTVMHAVDELSPLYGMTPEEVADSDLAIVVVMTGTDESFSQQVHARHTYGAKDIVWNRNFADIIGITDDGRPQIDYRRFHEVEEIPLPAAAE
jgi:inward rectifier potassium channel